MKEKKIKIEVQLPEEMVQQLTALAHGQQKKLDSLLEAALKEYIQKQKSGSPDEKINPIEDTATAKSWGYNSDVRGK